MTTRTVGKNYRKLASCLYSVLQERRNREQVKTWVDEIFNYILNRQNLRKEINETDRLYQIVVQRLSNCTAKDKPVLLREEQRLEEKKEHLLELVEIRQSLSGESLVQLIGG